MTRFVLIALAAATFATPALAQSSVKVAYSDLNLETHAGAQVMLARLNAAAHRVCGPAPSIQAIRRNDEYQTCVSESVSGAVAGLSAPLVTAAYNGAGAARQAVAVVNTPR